jgi:hypothetical protein
MVNAGDNIAIADGASRYDVAVSGNTTTYTIFADDAHTQQLAKLMLVA